MAETVIGVVEPIHEVWNPGDVVLGGDNLQLGEALENAAKDHHRQGSLDLGRQ
jgi:hypothetical protein